MTFAEAVAAAGGLLDIQADPGSVFLYRREPRELAEMLGVDCSKMDGPTVPIVYSVSFSDPAGYFLATRMQMHNKDVIFAANAQAVEITKFATFINTLVERPDYCRDSWHDIPEFADPQRDQLLSSSTVVSSPVVVPSPSR